MSISSIFSTGRRLMATTFADTCVIADRTPTRDSRGGNTVIWVDRTETVECRFVGLSDDLPTVENAQQFGVPTAVWLGPVDTQIDEGDRITNGFDGSKWIVTSDLTPPSELKICVRLGIREADRGEAN